MKCDFNDNYNYYLEEIKKVNNKNIKKIELIKESIEFYKNYNVDKKEFIDNLEKIINGD